jgi:hypothetical protein
MKSDSAGLLSPKQQKNRELHIKFRNYTESVTDLENSEQKYLKVFKSTFGDIRSAIESPGKNNKAEIIKSLE